MDRVNNVAAQAGQHNAHMKRLLDTLKAEGIDGDGVEGEIEVHYGGPVYPERGFLLHSTDVLLEGSIRVDERVALTARPEMLRAIARGDGPAQSVFTLGYAGWGRVSSNPNSPATTGA